MLSSLSRLVDNLTEGLYNDRWKDLKSFLDYMSTKDDQLILGVLNTKKIIRKIS